MGLFNLLGSALSAVKMGLQYKVPTPTPKRNAMNSGLSALHVASLISAFGNFTFSSPDCAKVRNIKIARLVETRDVGPFKVTAIKPALDDLEKIFAEVKRDHPDLYALLGTAGALCYRPVRGTHTTPSNHASGCAIDMTIAGVLSPFNAVMIPKGLITLYAYFHKYGWFWGAGYNGERIDPMHFEVSNERFLQWLHSGVLG